MKKWLQIGKIVGFCLCFLILAERIGLVVQVYGTEYSDPDRRNILFFSMPRDTVDVLMLGTSHVYCSYVPKQMFDDAGISCASLATSSQSFQNSYWLLKEALKYQKPKVVIMDIHPISSYADEENRDFRLHFTSGISVMPDLSINKLLAFIDIRNVGYGWSENMTIYDAYGILEYRNEYERGSGSAEEIVNLFFDPVSEYKTFGCYPTDTVYPMEEISPYVEGKEEINIYDTVGFKYLNMIYELLQKNDIELLLTRAPYNAQCESKSAYDQAFSWAEGHNIPIIDYFELMDETGINVATDFRDNDHLNYVGAQKATTYLTDYLVENYDLDDHRGNKRYLIWENREFDYQIIEERINIIIESEQAESP